MSIFEHHLSFQHFNDENNESESYLENETVNDLDSRDCTEKSMPNDQKIKYYDWGDQFIASCILCGTEENHKLYMTNCSTRYAGFICICTKCVYDMESKTRAVDRTQFSIEDTSNVCCAWCDIILGDELSWHYYDSEEKIYNTYNICNTCFGHSIELAKKQGTYINEPFPRLYRTDYSGFYNWPMRDPTTISYVIPESLQNDESDKPHITKELAELYIDLWDSFVHASTNGYFYFQEWTLITDFVDDEPGSTALAVRCVSDRPHQVASVVMDGHGRISIDTVYDNLDDFWKDYNEFINMRSKLTPEEKETRVNILKTKSADSCYCDDILMNNLMMDATNNFSTYIRLKYNYAFDYG